MLFRSRCIHYSAFGEDLQGKEKHCERKFGRIFVDCDGKRIGRPSGSFPANGTRNPRFRPNASRRGPTSLDICLGNSPPPASDRVTGWLNARQIKAGCILLPGAALLLHIAGGQPQIHGIIDHPAVLVGGDAPPDAVLCGRSESTRLNSSHLARSRMPSSA